MSYSEKNKRIASNTFFLYIRMFFILGVNLYTTRVLLRILGVEDYGIYNLIAGFIVMFTLFHGAMTTAAQRFLSYEIGIGDPQRIQGVFSVCFLFFLILSTVMLLLAETVGLWFFTHYLNIPEARIVAGHWVYQFSLFALLAKMLQLPYTAIIVSYEKMSFFAYIAILEVVMRLGAVFLLPWVALDSLVLYTGLVGLMGVVIFLCDYFYCRYRFPVCRLSSKTISRGMTKEIFSFSGWSLLGALANMLKSQGLNVLLNIFCGVVLNTVWGLSNQIGMGISQFVTSFQQAFNPQIVKSYAQNDHAYFHGLIINTSKYSFLLIWCVALPFLLKPEFILKLWLGEVPEYLVAFSVLTLSYFILDAIAAPLWLAIQATGKVKIYQITISCLIMLIFLLSWLFLAFGSSPLAVMVISCVVNLGCYVYRIFYLKWKVGFSIRSYWTIAMKPVLIQVLLTAGLGYLGAHRVPDTLVGVFVFFALLTVGNVILAYFLLLGGNERRYILNLVRAKTGLFR